MSNMPQPYSTSSAQSWPGQFASAYGVTAAPKPMSVTVLAVIGIIVGGIGCLNHGLGLLLYDSESMSTGAYLWRLVNSILSVALGGLLLVASIRTLKRQAAGRKQMLAWAWAYLLLLGLRLVGRVLWTMSADVDRWSAELPRDAVLTWMYIGAVLAVALFAIYPVCVLIWMNRPHVRAAFGEQRSW